MKKLFRCFLIIILSITIFIPCTLTNLHAEAPDNEEFDQFLTDEWVAQMEDSYVNMHFSVKDYKSYGITKPEVNLGSISEQDNEKLVNEYKESLKKLETFNYDSLSDSQKTSFDAYKEYLEEQINLGKYSQFDEYLNPYTGELSNELTNFTEFVFYEKEDIDDYLTLLSSYPEYIDQMISITQSQASQGYFMTDSTLSEADSQIDDFTSKTDDNELIVVFDENIDSFQGLSDEEVAHYKATNKDIVLNQIIPAYKKTKEELDKLKGSRKNDGGMALYPNGKEYYLALAQYKTSTSLSIEEMMDLCESVLSDSSDFLYSILLSKNNKLNDPEQLKFSGADEILNYLKGNISDWPTGPDVNYKASYLDDSVANPSIIAYYVTSPLDDYVDNTIKINGNNVNDVNALYGTLAHEGFPGHLYQTTYYLSKNPNPLRATISFIGYQEGWAQYSEVYMYENSTLDNYSASYEEFNTVYSYVLNAEMDLAVNGLGMSLDELTKYMNDKGYNYTSDQLKDSYDYLVATPGSILPYGIGLAEFMLLRAKAEASLTKSFDPVSFNECLLDNGSRPFTILEKDVDQYIKEKGGTIADEYHVFTYYGVGAKRPSSLDSIVRKFMIAAVIILALLILLIVWIVKRHRDRKRKQLEERARQLAMLETVKSDKNEAVDSPKSDQAADSSDSNPKKDNE